MIPWLAIAAALTATAPTANVTAQPRPQLDPAVVRQVLGGAAAQVKRCYRSPRIGHEARQIVTRLIVRLGPDGALTALPELADQTGITPGNQPFAREMAEAAVLAVMRCAPLRLPPEHYDRIWREFELTFSMAGSA